MGIERLIPAWAWLRRYGVDDLRGDLVAGAVVAVMLVPQSMAYAMLAGLPPVVGLYSATFPLLAYALFGTSRHLAVGPVAMVSLLVAGACSGVAAPGTAEYLGAAALLALLVGAVQLGLGFLRAGFLLHFVSHAVVGGFTAACAILIGLSQLRHLLGIDLKGSRSAALTVVEAATRIGETHGLTLAIGVVSILALTLARIRRIRFPVVLLVVAGAAWLVWALDLDRQGVRTVGIVPRGLPAWSVPAWSLDALRALLPSAAAIVFVGFMESMAVAQWIATRERYGLDPNRELIGLGVANTVAAVFSGYAVTGGFSRTAVSYQSGARTPMASVAAALLVLLTLLALTPLFTSLPNAVLAAVILVAVAGLVDVKEGRRLFHIKKADGWTYAATFLGTLLIGIEQGLLGGIVLSLVLFVARSSRPRTVVLGRIADRDEFRDVERYPQAVTHPDLLMVRVDASLYFANARCVEDRIRAWLAMRPEARWVLMDMSGVNDVDAVAVETMERLMEDAAARGVGFAFSGMKAQVRDVVARAGWREGAMLRMGFTGLGPALSALRAGATGAPDHAQAGEDSGPRAARKDS